jgi:uncharacterized membrane protein required for colicin V production
MRRTFSACISAKVVLIHRMTIWLLAAVLLVSLAGLGRCQGAIRAACSLLGILAAAWLAGPLAKLVRPLLRKTGMNDPLLLWLLATLAVFVIVLGVFKIVGQVAHRQVLLHFKDSKADVLRMARWQRLNGRLGLCLGLISGTVYLVLISFVIYAASYWTVQLAAADQDSKAINIINRLGWDLQRTGMTKVAAAIDPLPASYYSAANLAGLIYHHPLLEARLSRYPAFLTLGQQPEFQKLGQDTQFYDMWLKQQPIRTLLTNSAAKAILKNPGLLDFVWSIVEPDLEDARIFLETGKSPKFGGEAILGCWAFDVNGAIAAYRTARPSIAPADLQRVTRLMMTAFAKTSLMAATDHTVWLKNAPSLKAQAGSTATNEIRSLQGQWNANTTAPGQYELTLQGADTSEVMKAKVDGDWMTVTGDGLPLAFTKDD